MDQKMLTVSDRTELRKGASGRLRREAKIPAVVYGSHGNRNVTVDSHEFHTSFKTISENTIIDLKCGKDSFQVFIKDYQKDIITGKIQHIDFYEIDKNKAIHTHVPFKFTGNPVGVRDGGSLEHKMEDIMVECLPKDLPEAIIVAIENMGIGDVMHVRDLPNMNGIKFLAQPDQTVVVITHIKAEVIAAPEAEVAAAPVAAEG
jgi:large subunit ribosomal protein L25